MKKSFLIAAGALRAWPWLHVVLVLGCLSPSGLVNAADAPQWSKICEAVPDKNCATWIQFNRDGGLVMDLAIPFALVSLAEPARDSAQKVLRIVVHFEAAPATQNGNAQLIVDSKQIAEVLFTRCAGVDCVGETQAGVAELAALEHAQSIEVRSAGLKAAARVGGFAEARNGRGKTPAEIQAEQEQLAQKMQKRAGEIKKEIEERKNFLSEAPAAHMPDGFCAALKGVMAAAPDKFISIRGQKDDVDWLARTSLPGSGKCHVSRSLYSCAARFKRREIAEEQMNKLLQIIGKCLPRSSIEREQKKDRLEASFKDDKSDVDVSVMLNSWQGGVDGHEVEVWVR